MSHQGTAPSTMAARGLHRRLGLAILLATAWPAVAAEAPQALSQCIRERWTYREGLPHNVVHRLLAARSGYLWIGTQEGLVRFDGVRFKVFTHLDTPGLAGNEITALLEDRDGLIWIGTSRGLSLLRDGAFETLGLGADAAVTALSPDDEGGLWVATEGDGVRRVRPGATPRVERLEGLEDQRVLTLARLGRELWIGGYGGLARLVDGRLEVMGTAGLPSEVVTSLRVTRDGVLWVGTSRGLARRTPGSGRLETVPFAGSSLVLALLEDHLGALWVGTEGRPLVRVWGDRAEAVVGTVSPLDVHTLAEDGEGDLWAGTESGGLYRLRWGQVVTMAREEGLSADVVWSVLQRRDESIWITSDGGLDRLRGGQVQTPHAAELRGARLGGLLEDRAGDLWVGTGDGVTRFGPRGARRYGKESGLADHLARTIHEDARGTVWLGTSHGVFRLVDDRFRRLDADPALLGDKVNALAEESPGRLWVGTTTALARVEGNRLVPATIGGQPFRGDVTALRAEPGGGLWIGTVGDGLARLTGDRLERWTQREGLFEDTVLAILDDGAGHLWLSGTRGISRVKRSDLDEVAAGRRGAVAPTAFGTADGMRERECNGGVEPSAWRARDGRLWFATIRGVAVIDPARLGPSQAPPPARVEEVTVDGHPWPVGGVLRLPAGTRRVDVRYTGLALAAAERIRFHHRLLGLDDAFLDAAGERVAHFTTLDPGRYLFEVAAASAAGAWGPPATLAFEIEPHPWQTPWFALTVALATLGLAVGVHLARTRSLHRREAALAARVDEEMRKVKLLTGLLPTCAWCKKIRDEGGAWQQFEDYVSTRTDAQFTHGMCPECFERVGRQGDDS